MKQRKFRRNGIIRENMIIIVLLSLIAVNFAAITTSVEPSPRSVNVALETSFLFEPEHINDNIAFIKKIKVFLDKVYKFLEPQAKLQQEKQFRAKPERRFSFGDIMKKIGDSVANFTTDKFQDAVKIINDEMKKIGNTSAIQNIGDKSKTAWEEIMKHHKIADDWTSEQAEKLKNEIKKIMSEKNRSVRNFARRMNNYYTEDDVKKLNKIIRKLNRHVKNDRDISKVIKELLLFGVVDKFNSLNETSKRNMIKDINLLSEFHTKNKKIKSKSEMTYRRNPPMLELVLVTNKNTEKDPDYLKRDNRPVFGNTEIKGNAREELNDSVIYPILDRDLKKPIGIKLKSADKNEDSKQKGATNEIVVNNVELIVQKP